MAQVKAVKCSQEQNSPSELLHPGGDEACSAEMWKSSPSPVVRAMGICLGQCQRSLHHHHLASPVPGHWNDVGAKAPAIPALAKGNGLR